MLQTCSCNGYKHIQSFKVNRNIIIKCAFFLHEKFYRMYRQGRLSKHKKCETRNISALTVSIGMAIWIRARVTNLKHQPNVCSGDTSSNWYVLKL